jgi:hypothetical protein
MRATEGRITGVHRCLGDRLRLCEQKTAPAINQTETIRRTHLSMMVAAILPATLQLSRSQQTGA